MFLRARRAGPACGRNGGRRQGAAARRLRGHPRGRGAAVLGRARRRSPARARPRAEGAAARALRAGNPARDRLRRGSARRRGEADGAAVARASAGGRLAEAGRRLRPLDAGAAATLSRAARRGGTRRDRRARPRSRMQSSATRICTAGTSSAPSASRGSRSTRSRSSPSGPTTRSRSSGTRTPTLAELRRRLDRALRAPRPRPRADAPVGARQVARLGRIRRRRSSSPR